MVDENDDGKPESRPPTIADLVRLCRALNQERAQYIVIGGMAMIQAGFVRATVDIDLLIEVSQENQVKVRTALMTLPDQAVRDVQPDDIERYMVVRIADEFVIDLMAKACGVDFSQAMEDIEHVAIDGVVIPFASAKLMWRLKQTNREKDELDRLFLREFLKNKE